MRWPWSTTVLRGRMFVFLIWANNASCLNAQRHSSLWSLVLMLDTATSQGLLVPEFWAGPIPTLSARLARTCHFPFVFPEMRRFLLNSQHTECSLYILCEQSWLLVWERLPPTPPSPTSPVLWQAYLPGNTMISQAANNLILCPLSGGSHHIYTLSTVGGYKRCGV